MIVTGQDRRVAEWMAARMEHRHIPADVVCIGWEKDGELVAGVGFDRYNGASICMHVAAEGRHWLTREYLWFCFWYPFEQLKVRKVLGLVPSTNAQAQRFDKHLGFAEECRITDAVPGGDLIVYSMTREQCRYLERSNHVPRQEQHAACA